MIPYYPNDDDNMDTGYIIETLKEKRIAEYLGITMFDVEELDIVEYLFYLREAFIYNSSQTEEGREYLRNAKRLEETSPDRQTLKRNFGNSAIKEEV